jgi:hypothetical protein
MSVVNFDHPEEYLFPRFTPGSLAERVAEGEIGTLHPVPPGRCMMLAEADAVERLTDTASSLLSIIEEYMRGDDLDFKAVRKELAKHASVIEAVETWKP